MKRIALYTLLFLSTSIGQTAYSQKIAAVFASMPAEQLEVISVNQRKDMIDFYKSGRKDKVKNSLGGESYIAHMSDSTIDVQITPVSKMEMRILPQNDTIMLVGIIRTVCAPACHSKIEFYNSINWVPIKENLYTPLKADHFLKNNIAKDSREYTTAMSLIDMFPITASFEGNNIILKTTVQDYLPEEIYKQLQPFLVNTPVIKKWDGMSYE